MLKFSESIIECKQCVLTSTDTQTLSLNDEGICNYCTNYNLLVKSLGDKDEKAKHLNEKVREIKKYGENKPYDCLLGLSGGMDSSYLANWCKEKGLRPLIVHLDNGWNSDLAIKNIVNICKLLNLELHTYVINWEEFREMQVAYLRSGVIDMEVLTDHAIFATLHRLAKKHNIKYIISGFNIATEAIMPKDWIFDKGDWSNIKDIVKQYGRNVKVKTYPHLSFFKRLYYSLFVKIESVQVLNYIEFNKIEVKKFLIEHLDWMDYGGKHYESIFTKFYQIYILPLKFKVDKRKAHLSTLICSGQTTREDALKELQKTMVDQNTIREEKEYILKKINISEGEFDKIMRSPVRKHSDFKSEAGNWELYFKLLKILRPWKI